jgi:lipoic acid synthetase
MLMGDTCTRGCGFCGVKRGYPRGKLDVFEPIKVAKAVAELRLKYVVLTSVDRDDLADGGASHFANTIRAIRWSDVNVIVEVLIPDFLGDLSSVKKIIDAGPQVVAHNVETTEHLTSKVRDRRAGYNQSLRVLKNIKELDPSVYSKSSIMLGLGEIEDDLFKTVRDLREANVDILTLGQYLRPSKGHIPVEEYVSPDKFRYYQRMAEELGFLYVASGPFVRSSFKAGEFFLEAVIRRTKSEGANSALKS